MGPHKVNIINILQLIATPADQLAYQAVAPVNVARELVNQWFDDFYHPDSPQFLGEFSAAELAWLAEFHACYDAYADQLPDSLAEMLQSSLWAEVMAGAGRVLDLAAWRGMDARYESQPGL
jgi:hypothetical protein